MYYGRQAAYALRSTIEKGSFPNNPDPLFIPSLDMDYKDMDYKDKGCQNGSEVNSRSMISQAVENNLSLSPVRYLDRLAARVSPFAQPVVPCRGGHP
jgi:hypothetical protein